MRPKAPFDADTMSRPPAGDRAITDPTVTQGINPSAMVYGPVLPRVSPGVPGNLPPHELSQNILNTLWNAGNLTPPEMQIGKVSPLPAIAANTAATDAITQTPNPAQPVGQGALALPSSLHIKASTIPAKPSLFKK